MGFTTGLDLATQETLFQKIIKDFQENWMPRKETLICLSSEEIILLFEDESKDVESSLRLSWHLKFYLKQLLLASAKLLTEASIKKALDKTKFLIDFHSERQIRSLWATLLIEYFMDTISDYELYDLFNGTTYYDDHIAQKAYEEYLRRKDNKKD
ncbi:hypothetical protein IT402_00160 [Candidatus Nomurabacteria bacterium]|nr:hypothetical protein [Candidatus Nomurabacteria bacterium]